MKTTTIAWISIISMLGLLEILTIWDGVIKNFLENKRKSRVKLRRKS